MVVDTIPSNVCTNMNHNRPASIVSEEAEVTKTVILHLDPTILPDFISHYPRSQLLTQIEAAFSGGGSVSTQCSAPSGSELTVNLAKLGQLGDNGKKREDGSSKSVLEMRLVGTPSVVLSIKKEMLSRAVHILTNKSSNTGDICVHSSVNESVALLRQTHQVNHLISAQWVTFELCGLSLT